MSAVTVHSERRRTRDGFTVVELLVSIVLIGLLTGVIAAAVSVILRSEDGVVATTAESHDTRQVVSYLPHDVESGPGRANAYRATIGGEPGDRGSGCSEFGNENVLRIDVTDRRSDLIDKRVAYRVVVAGDQARLDRYECRFDGAAWVQSGVINVADYLDPAASPIAEAEIIVDNPAAAVSEQEVRSVVLRYVQRGQAESIEAAPREEQPLGTSGVCGAEPLAPARNMATFVQGDVTLHGTTVKSSLYVGGTLTFHGGSVAAALPDLPESPIPSNVGLLAGSVNWAGSTGVLDVKPHHDVLIEDSNYFVAGRQLRASSTSSSSPRIEIGAAASVITPGTERVLSPGEAFADLRACSDRLAELPNSCDNGTCAAHIKLPPGYGGTAADAGSTRLDLQPDLANAFNIDVANLYDLRNIQIQFAPGDSPATATPLIINVRTAIGATVNFEAPVLQGSGANSVYVIWNFPNADVVNVLPGDELRGTLLAPYAEVTSRASIQGGVIARTFNMYGSSLNDVRSFQGQLAW